MKHHGIKGLIALIFSVLLSTSPALAASGSSSWGWDSLVAYAKLSSTIDTHITIPVLMGVEVNDLYDSWGAARSGGRTHEGIDIMAPKGTPIVSPGDAIVTKIGYGTLGGNYVFTLNAGGEKYYYAHLDSYAAGLFEGQVLKKGDLIGYVGNTGDAITTPPHLHFGIYTSKGAINPFDRITQAFTTSERVTALNNIVTNANNQASTATSLVQKYKNFLSSVASQGLTLTQMLSDVLIGKVYAGTESSSSYAIARTLQVGSVGTDVNQLQHFLNTHGSPIATTGIGSLGNESTYFGSATKNALIRYQKAQGITPTGIAGPLTRANITAQSGTVAMK